MGLSIQHHTLLAEMSSDFFPYSFSHPSPTRSKIHSRPGRPLPSSNRPCHHRVLYYTRLLILLSHLKTLVPFHFCTVIFTTLAHFISIFILTCFHFMQKKNIYILHVCILHIYFGCIFCMYTLEVACLFCMYILHVYFAASLSRFCSTGYHMSSQSDNCTNTCRIQTPDLWMATERAKSSLVW